MSAIDFEPTDVKDLTMPERTVIEGANVIDYDVEYGVLPVDPDQLAAPTHNIAVPAEGTLGPYQTDGEGESDIWKVVGATVKAGGKGYAKDATVKVPGKYPSDVPAVIKIDSLTDASHYEVTTYSLGAGGQNFVVGEKVYVPASVDEGETKAEFEVTAVKAPETYYVINAVTNLGSPDLDEAQSGEWDIVIPASASGERDAIISVEKVPNPDPEAPEPVQTVITVSDGGKFFTDPAGSYSGSEVTVHGSSEITIQDITVTSAETTLSGVIDTVTMTNPGYFATIKSGMYSRSGSLSGTGAALSITTTAVSDGVIGSVSIVSEGSYARELDGDIDVVAGNGTGGKITVDMEMEEPESGEESGSEE